MTWLGSWVWGTYEQSSGHLQHTATRCKALQQNTTHCNTLRWAGGVSRSFLLTCATFCNTLQHTTTQCKAPQHTLQHIATQSDKRGHLAKLPPHVCNTLQHTATCYNTLQHTATHCNTLQHTATHCNTLQHTATHCNTIRWAWPSCEASSSDPQSPRRFVLEVIILHNIFPVSPSLSPPISLSISLTFSHSFILFSFASV